MNEERPADSETGGKLGMQQAAGKLRDLPAKSVDGFQTFRQTLELLSSGQTAHSFFASKLPVGHLAFKFHKDSSTQT
jgi:hypothetical protein